MQEFKVGQEVMVVERYSSAENPTWNKKIVRLPLVVQVGTSSWNKKMVVYDPDNQSHKRKVKFVGCSNPIQLIKCWNCQGVGQKMVKQEPEILGEGVVYDPTTYVDCETCGGSGINKTDPYIEYTVNRKDRILPVEIWEETVGKEIKERNRQREERLRKQSDLEENLIDDIWSSISTSEDPKMELANLIRKYGYANVNGISTLYSAARKYQQRAEILTT